MSDNRLSAKARYPELNEIAEELFFEVINKINDKAKTVTSEMPYKAQCILELLVDKLENQI